MKADKDIEEIKALVTGINAVLTPLGTTVMQRLIEAEIEILKLKQAHRNAVSKKEIHYALTFFLNYLLPLTILGLAFIFYKLN